MAARDSAPNRTGYLALYNALLALRGGENELNRHISRGSFYTQPLPVMIRDIQYLINSKDPGRRFPQTIRKEDVPQYFNSLLKELNSHTEHDYFGKIELGLKRNNWSDLPPPPEEKIVSQPVNIPIETAEVIPVETDQVPETSKVTKEKEEPKYRGGGGVTKKPEEKTSENKAVVVPNPVTKTTVRNIVRSRLQNKAEITQIIRSAPRQQTPEAPTITRSSPETLPPKRPSAIKINLKQAQNAVSSTMGGPAKNLASNAIVQIIRHPGFKANLFSAGIGALGGGLIGGSLPAAGVGAVLGGLAGPEIGDRIGDYMTGGRGRGGGGSIQSSIKRRAQNAAEALTRRAARKAALAIGRVLIANSWWLVPLIGIILLLLIAILISLCILPWSGCEGSGGTNDLSKQIVIKKSAPLQVENGGSIEYKITVTNNGSAPTNVVVNDDLPADTIYESGDNDPVAEGTSVKKIQWNIRSLSPKQTKTLTFKVKPQKENMWVVNQVTGNIASSSGNFKPGGKGLLCVDDTDPRLVEFFESAGVSAGVAPAILYGIAKGENGGTIQPWSIDGKLHAISPCGAHGLMQIQHINDGLGKNYGSTCAAINGTSNPPEVFDGLSSKYNGPSGGNIVDADSDKDSIFGAAFYVQERSWPEGRSVTDQLTDQEVISVSSSYLGALNATYAQYYLNNYRDAYAKQNTCK